MYSNGYQLLYKLESFILLAWSTGGGGARLGSKCMQFGSLLGSSIAFM